MTADDHAENAADNAEAPRHRSRGHAAVTPHTAAVTPQSRTGRHKRATEAGPARSLAASSMREPCAPPSPGSDFLASDPSPPPQRVEAPRCRIPVAAPQDDSRARDVSATSTVTIPDRPRKRRRRTRHTRAVSSIVIHQDDKSRQQRERTANVNVSERHGRPTGCDIRRGDRPRSRSRGEARSRSLGEETMPPDFTPPAAAVPPSHKRPAHDVHAVDYGSPAIRTLEFGCIRRHARPASGSGSYHRLAPMITERNRGQVELRLQHLLAPICQSDECRLNLMLATWLLGNDADATAVADKLQSSPFDCVVVVMTKAVQEDSPVWQLFTELVDLNPRWGSVLAEKTVIRLTCLQYAVLHKAKVATSIWVRAEVRGASDGVGFELGSLELVLSTARQRTNAFRVGIVYVGAAVADFQVDGLVEFIKSENISVLTGHFGPDPAFLHHVAQRAGAIHTKPLFQGCTGHNPDGDSYDLTPPIWMICFGKSKNTIAATASFTVPSGWVMGKDVWREMIGVDRVPFWPLVKVTRSTPIPFLGKVTMKPQSAKTISAYWVANSFQLAVWLGQSTPGQNRKYKGRGHEGRDKGKGKGKFDPQSRSRKGSAERHHDPQSRFFSGRHADA
jgi:hypothetical protein